MSAFSFNLPAPSLKVSDLATYHAALAAWKATVAEMVALYPGLVQGLALPAPCPPPTVASLPALPGDKGACELAWIAKSGRKSVRFTARIQELYPDKESYCRALLQGEVKEEPEPKGEPEGVIPAPRFTCPEDVPDLF
jgi:hypothetical protein